MMLEVRRQGIVLCSSSVPDLGYSHETIRDMERNGLTIYCDGQRVKHRSIIANGKGPVKGARKNANKGTEQ